MIGDVVPYRSVIMKNAESWAQEILVYLQTHKVNTLGEAVQQIKTIVEWVQKDALKEVDPPEHIHIQ